MFTLPTYNVNNIQGLADLTKNQATAVKILFDKTGADGKAYIIALLEEMTSVADGDSGADNIGSTAIDGLSGTTVQALLESLKGYVDTNSSTKTELNNHKTSAAHDGRYYTEVEADAMFATFTELQDIVLGQIPDGSLTDVKLSNAEGDIKDRFAEHKADYAKHIEPIIKVNTMPMSIVTITKDGIDIVETADENGLTVLNPAFLGEWIVSASVSGMPMSASITVDKVAVFETSLMPATLNVQTLAGTEVSLIKDTITINVTASEAGLAVFRPAIGVWTLSAVFSGVTVSKEVSIADTGIYNEGLSPVLSDCSWADVDAFSRAGVAGDIWAVGDTKTLKVDGVDYVAQIIGFEHDNLTTPDGARAKAGITFQLKDCLATTYNMENANINTNGWTGCVMRTSTMSTLLSQLETALRNVIKPVDKLTSIGNQSATIRTDSDKLFLLSEIEIFDTLKYSKAGEGYQYDYYAAGNSKIKNVDGSAALWWERSPDGSAATFFCSVGINGSAGYDYASSAYGVSFGFCI